MIEIISDILIILLSDTDMKYESNTYETEDDIAINHIYPMDITDFVFTFQAEYQHNSELILVT